MNDAILTADGLCKTYLLGRQKLDVLCGVNLAIGRGQVLVIKGASGAGKSTLLHLLGGLDKPSAGEVAFEGKSLRKLDLVRWRNECVGFVFQSYNLLPELDALENVCLPSLVGDRRLGARHQIAERGRQLLRSVGLGERMQHRPAELSGGEQQRVAIARALMNRPCLVLADEPTGNLDSRTGEAILDLLWQMRSESGATLVMVTHDEHIARRGERVLEIADGRLSA